MIGTFVEQRNDGVTPII